MMDNSVGTTCQSLDDIGHCVYRVRQHLGLTQSEVAQKIGVTRQWIGRIERGKSAGADLQTILDLLNVLGISLYSVDPIPVEQKPVKKPAVQKKKPSSKKKALPADQMGLFDMGDDQSWTTSSLLWDS